MQQQQAQYCHQLQHNVNSLQHEIANITRRKQQKEQEARNAGKIAMVALGPISWAVDAATDGGVSNALAGVVDALRQELEGKTQRADAQRRELYNVQSQINNTVNAVRQSQNMVNLSLNQYQNEHRQLDARQRALEDQIKAFGRFIVDIGNIKKGMDESKRRCGKVLKDIEMIADMAGIGI